MAGSSDAYRWGIEMLVLPVDRSGEVWVPLRKKRGIYRFFTRDDAEAFINDALYTSQSARFRPVMLPSIVPAKRRSVAAARRYV